MIGNLCLHQLVNDGLMPELFRDKDENLFRDIWKVWNSDNSRDGKAFLYPASSFKLFGIKISVELTNDWSELKKEWKLLPEQVPVKNLMTIFPAQHRTRFFVALFWQTIHIQFHVLSLTLRNEQSVQHQQYLLMHYITDLEQWMDDNEKKMKNSSQEIIRGSFQQIMIFYWLQYVKKFKDLLHVGSLRYFKEDLEFSLKDVKTPIQKLQEYLVDQLKEPVVLSREEFEKMAPLEIMAQFKDDIDEINAALHQLQPLEMEQDVYLKPKDVHEIFGIAQSTLAQWRTVGKLKKYKKVGNRYEYSQKELKLVVHG